MSAFGVGANVDLGQPVKLSTALSGALPVLLVALLVAGALISAGATWFSRSEVK